MQGLWETAWKLGPGGLHSFKLPWNELFHLFVKRISHSKNERLLVGVGKSLLDLIEDLLPSLFVGRWMHVVDLVRFGELERVEELGLSSKTTQDGICEAVAVASTLRCVYAFNGFGELLLLGRQLALELLGNLLGVGDPAMCFYHWESVVGFSTIGSSVALNREDSRQVGNLIDVRLLPDA